MTTKVKKVHYCDYCGKHGMRGHNIEKHEKHCTLNPNRECGLCGRMDGIEDFIKKYSKIGKIEQIVGEVDIDKLKDEIGYCPACTLAIIRCAGLQHVEFDYQKELKEWWEEKNASEEYISQNYN